MKKKYFLILILCFSLLFGCSLDKRSAVQTDSHETITEPVQGREVIQIEKLQQEIRQKDETLKQLKEAIDVLEYNIRFDFDKLQTELLMMKHVLNSLPDVTKKQGFITKTLEENGNQYLSVNIAEFIVDDTMPNGFRIDDKKETVKVKVTPEMQMARLSRVDVNQAKSFPNTLQSS